MDFDSKSRMRTVLSSLMKQNSIDQVREANALTEISDSHISPLGGRSWSFIVSMVQWRNILFFCRYESGYKGFGPDYLKLTRLEYSTH